MKRILLPTDFSANAFNAIEYAVHFFMEEKCQFYLLNTYTPAIFDNEYISYNTNITSLVDYHQQDRIYKLRKVIKKIKEVHPNKNHSFKAIATFNLLSEEIKFQVRDKKIDLVVMGTKGATGASQFLFGTQTVHVLRIATFPVLAIPSQFRFKAPEKILFPTDLEFHYSNDPSVILIKEVLRMFHAKPLVLHILNEKPLSATQKIAKRRLENSLKEFNSSFNIVEQKNIAQAIFKFQEKNDVDMLILRSHKRSFFENLFFRPLSSKIGFLIKIPFLMIPSTLSLEKEKEPRSSNLQHEKKDIALQTT